MNNENLNKEPLIKSAIDKVNYFISQIKKENEIDNTELEEWKNQVVTLLNKANKIRFAPLEFKIAYNVNHHDLPF
jgi:hypothetical protein